MSESPVKSGDAPSATGQVRNLIRGRMRAAPNVAISSGMARNRRLSGHFPAAPEKSIHPDPVITPSAATTSDIQQQIRSRSPSISHSRSPSKLSARDVTTASNSTVPVRGTDDPLNENSDRETLLNTQFNAQMGSSVTAVVQGNNKPKSPAPHQASVRMPFLSKINSPKLLDSHEGATIAADSFGSPLNQNQSISGSANANLSFRQYISYQSNVLQKQSNVSLVPLSPSVSMPPTPGLMPCTPGGTEYNPRFSNEHIMNIIKHKSLQKLKKIEAESLKEKRKSYQTLLLNESILNGQLENTNSNDSTASVPIDRSKTRMRDLLYYNSKKKTNESSNEIILDSSTNSPPGGGSEVSSSPGASENSVEADLSNAAEKAEAAEAAKRQQQMLNSAPQLKFAEDGSIIINEESLIINREEEEPVFNDTVVEGEQIDNLTYISYRKFHHTKKWTERETAKFYKALGMIGTDFTMIQRLFHHRSRDEIKRKFKREEKLNQALIDKIMSKTSEIDLSVFVSASSDDEARKKSNSNNSIKTLKKRSLSNGKTKSPPTESKAKVLKRIQKRAFIESDSDKEDDVSEKEQPQPQAQPQPLGQSTVDNLVVLTSTVNKTLTNQASMMESSSDEESEEDLVLDLDNNTITSQKTVINVDNYSSEMLDQRLELSNVSEQEDNIILDLDNNTIVTNKETISIDLESRTESQGADKLSSKIVITPLIKRQT